MTRARPAGAVRDVLRGALFGAAGALAASANVCADLEQEEIVVFGQRSALVTATPKSVSVVTASELESGSSVNVTDLLAREANLNQTSFFGSDKFGGIDIRGMGAASVSNVLVLADGMRLNAPDLAGADYTSLPLANLSRIEIIRGANAARYGGGAVGGVINLVTAPVTGDEPLEVTVSARSFGTVEGRISGGYAIGDLALHGSATMFESSGYRDNGELAKRDVAVRLAYRPRSWLTGTAEATYHHDRYGLPGPVSAATFAESEDQRRGTRTPYDGGRTDDRRYRAGLEADLGAYGGVRAEASFRDRRNPFVIGYSSLLPRDEQQAEIREETWLVDLSYRLPVTVGAVETVFGAGVNAQESDYARFENGRGLPDRSRVQQGDVSSLAGYVTFDAELPHDLGLSFAWRRARFELDRRTASLEEVCDVVNESRLVEVAPGVLVPVVVPVRENCRAESRVGGLRSGRWTNEAVDLGLVWQATETLGLFANVAQSYRNPNVDELSAAARDIRPQRGRHVESGIRWRQDGRFEFALALFAMTIEDEILFAFEPETNRALNRNAPEDVERYGGEFEVKAYLHPRVFAWSNLGYTRARFADSGGRVPLTPRFTASAGVEWEAAPEWTLAVSGRHVGTRADGNALGDAEFPELSAFEVADVRANWRRGRLHVFAGVNNLFDEVYSTQGYSGTLYPMPARNFFAGFSLQL